MATQTAAVPALRDDFRYTPGDGYQYTWTKGQPIITVWRVVTSDPWAVERTGDTIPAPATATAAALMAAVDALARA